MGRGKVSDCHSGDPRGSQTLYRIAMKAGLYSKAVQVCLYIYTL